MKRHQEMITTIIALGLACAMQAGKTDELPDQVRQFAAEQHQEILVQGMEARQAIRYKLREDAAAYRMAFMESQGRSIANQGNLALAAIKENFRGNAIASREAQEPGRSTVAGPAGQEAARPVAVALRSPESRRPILRLAALRAWTQPVPWQAVLGPAVRADASGYGS